MKKFLYIFYFIFIFSIPIIFIGCLNKNTPPIINEPLQLSFPIPIWQDNLICWNKIDNAIGYTLKINEEEISTENNFYDLTVISTPKTYNIEVKALGDNINFLNSCYSNTLTLTSQFLKTPYISSHFGDDHSFKLASDKNSGTIAFTTCENADFVKVWVNDDQYIVENKHEIKILSSMCKAGQNQIKIQASSNNKLFLDSDFLTDTVYKEDAPTNIKVKNGNIVWGFPERIYNSQYYDNLGYGNLRVPVIQHGYMETMSSDPVYIDVYRTKPLDTYSVNCVFDSDLYQYNCSTTLETDLNLDTSDGTDYDKLEIIVYTSQEQKYMFNLNTIEINKTIEFSIIASSYIEKITFRLYNSEHPEYVNTITTIYDYKIHVV